MVNFDDVEDLRAHLVDLNKRYGIYTERMWELGVWSTEMIANSREETLATILSHPTEPGLSHRTHASDMIARSRPAGVLMRIDGVSYSTPMHWTFDLHWLSFSIVSLP